MGYSRRIRRTMRSTCHIGSQALWRWMRAGTAMACHSLRTHALSRRPAAPRLEAAERWIVLGMVALCLVLPTQIGGASYAPLPAPGAKPWVGYPLGPSIWTQTPGRRHVSAVALFKAVSYCHTNLPVPLRWHIAGVIRRESVRFGYDPLFVIAMAEVESTCSPHALGPRGAVGLIQVKPSTARLIAQRAGIHWRGPQMLTQPRFNIRLGLHYLRHLEDRFGDRSLALAAYNMGPTRVAGMSPARARTVSYVQKILSRYAHLRNDVGPS